MHEPRTQQPEKLREAVEHLDEWLDGSQNYAGYFPHSDRKGLIGYNLFFYGDYLFPRAMNKIREHGLEIHSMSYDCWEYEGGVQFKAIVVEKDRRIREV